MILYKYLHPDRIDVLTQKMVRFTQPGDFNDPFEFRPYIQSAAQMISFKNTSKPTSTRY
jgi:hypothetical protein